MTAPADHPGAARPESNEKNRLCRVLSPLVDIRTRELERTASAALAIFLLMTSYYIMKSIRSSKFLADFGSYYLLFTYFANALLTLFTVLAYNHLVERFDRKDLIQRVYGAVFVLFATVWAVNARGIWQSGMTIVNYFAVCVYILLLTSLLWSLIHDIFEAGEAARLYGIVLLAGQAGVSVGGKITSSLARELGTMNLIPVSLVFLGMTYLAVLRLERFEVKVSARAETKSTGSLADLRSLLSDPYARLIGLLVILSTFAVTSIDWQFNRMLETEITIADARTAFFGSCFYWQGFLNIFLLVVSGRVIAHLGPVAALLSLPLVTLCAAGAYVGQVGISVAAVLWVLCQSMNYTLYNAGKENLYVPTDRLFKYKYKALNDAAGYRLGDASAAAMILAYMHLISATWLSGIGIGVFMLGAFWVPAVFRANRSYLAATARASVEETAPLAAAEGQVS